MSVALKRGRSELLGAFLQPCGGRGGREQRKPTWSESLPRAWRRFLITAARAESYGKYTEIWGGQAASRVTRRNQVTVPYLNSVPSDSQIHMQGWLPGPLCHRTTLAVSLSTPLDFSPPKYPPAQ